MNNTEEINGLADTSDNASSSIKPPSESQGSTVPNQPADASGRLRGSCECCAKSKVRCGKEKPTCARCATRGSECVYLASRRPGRVPGQHSLRSNPKSKSDRDEKKNSVAVLPRSPCHRKELSVRPEASNQAVPHVEVAPMYPLSPETEGNMSQFVLNDTAASTSTSIEELSNISATPTSSTDYQQDWFFDFNEMSIDAASMDLSMDDTMLSSLLDFDHVHGPAEPVSLGGNVNNLGASCIPAVDYLTSQDANPPSSQDASGSFDTLVSPPSSSSSSAVDLGSLASSTALLLASGMTGTTLPVVSELDAMDEDTSDDSCDCVTQALDIFRALSRPRSSGSSSAQRRPSSDTILTQNKQSVESTLGLLECSGCKDDQFLLVVCLMIAMKLLGRYASVASSCDSRRQSTDLNGGAVLSGQSDEFKPRKGSLGPGGTSSMAGMSRSSISTARLPCLSSDGANEDVSPRVAKQSVLRELHRVQRLITQLPSRIKQVGVENTAADGFDGIGIDTQPIDGIKIPTLMGADNSPGESIPTSPLSARVLGQVEGDIRTTLKRLSASLRHSLRNS